ncbi:hypothetical protein AB0N06_23285 [Streptomyces sp. NPDC051020]|uniref:hypothetical protein n=1 Tax=Streptomyces sp. NPDC051020 TaxID=3155409 RepID=UPI0034207624
MTTARDLALVTLGLSPDRPVGQGDLSLALSGAEAVDLLTCGALTLDRDRMVPGPRMETGDRLQHCAARAHVTPVLLAKEIAGIDAVSAGRLTREVPLLFGGMARASFDRVARAGRGYIGPSAGRTWSLSRTSPWATGTSTVPMSVTTTGRPDRTGPRREPPR